MNSGIQTTWHALNEACLRPLMLLVVATLALTAANVPNEKPVVEPWTVTVSANAGRAGIYQAPTRYGAYNYYVCVPSTYSADNPAGVHLFFHGQSGQAGAPDFNRWKKYFLEPFNLIGINMQYMDGDNGKDTEGKIAAAQQAMAQVCADYKVIIPRGLVSSFSGGGHTQGLMASMYSQERGPRWPFTMSSIYSSNYRKDATLGVAMAWYIGVGTEEWDLARLGVTAVNRASEVYRGSAQGNPDVFLNITRKGHDVTDADTAVATTLFVLSDLAYAPGVYVPDYSSKELKDLRPMVEQANALQFGTANAALTKLLARPTLAEPVKTAGMRLQTRLNTRLDAVAAMIKRLATEDPVRAVYYGPLLLAQLKGSANEKDARAALIAQGKDKATAKTLAAHGEFAKLVPALFGENAGNPSPVPDKLSQLKLLAPLLGDRSESGLVAAGFLRLAPNQEQAKAP